MLSKVKRSQTIHLLGRKELKALICSNTTNIAITNEIHAGGYISDWYMHQICKTENGNTIHGLNITGPCGMPTTCIQYWITCKSQQANCGAYPDFSVYSSKGYPM